MPNFADHLRKTKNQAILKKNIAAYNAAMTPGAKQGELARILNDIEPDKETVESVVKKVHRQILTGDLTNWMLTAVKDAALNVCDPEGQLIPEIKKILIANGMNENELTSEFTKGFISSMITNQYGLEASKILNSVVTANKNVSEDASTMPDSDSLRVMLSRAQITVISGMSDINAAYMERSAEEDILRFKIAELVQYAKAHSQEPGCTALISAAQQANQNADPTAGINYQVLAQAMQTIAKDNVDNPNNSASLQTLYEKFNQLKLADATSTQKISLLLSGDLAAAKDGLNKATEPDITSTKPPEDIQRQRRTGPPPAFQKTPPAQPNDDNPEYKTPKPK